MEKHVEDACCAASRLPSHASAPATNRPIVQKTAGSKEGMVLLDGGEFLMGTEDDVGFPADGEGPVRQVKVKPLYVDECSVTNNQFEQFVRATSYRTEAERFGWSFVFHTFVHICHGESLQW